MSCKNEDCNCGANNKLFTVIASRWFDSVNGNTYHSVHCVRHSDGAIIGSGKTLVYGYDRQYEVTALKLMHNAGWIVVTENQPAHTYERNNDYPVVWSVSDGLKRDAVANGVGE